MWDKPRLLLGLANLLYALAAVLSLYVVLFLLVRLPVFPLKQVKVVGHMQHVSRAQLQLVIGERVRGNFFTLDLAHVREAFQKLPWVRNVSVRRRWPDQLEVVLEEHQALARWSSGALVNTHGELFQAAIDKVLPTFSGPPDSAAEVTQQFMNFQRILQPTKLEIGALTLSARRAWQIHTRSGMLIEIGREDVASRLRKFASVYHKTLGLLHVPIAYADLRYPNGFAVRKPEAIPAPVHNENRAAKISARTPFRLNA